MAVKIMAGLVALILILGYLLPPVFKLKDAALGVVIIVGLSMMAVDLWQSLKSKED
jgi:uncharacterized membrane protein